MKRTAVLAGLVLVGVVCIAAGGGPAASKPAQRGRAKVAGYTCSMHPQIRLPEAGNCPICMMELIPVLDPEPVKKEQKVSVPKGGLKDFCRRYIEEKLTRLNDHDEAEAYSIVSAYAALRGKRAIPRFRKLLTSAKFSAVQVAAYHLGEWGDRAAIPQLKRVMASLRPKLAARFTCREHGQASFRKPGKCTKCNRELTESVPAEPLVSYIAVAGALHQMGEKDGFEALASLVAKRQIGWLAYDTLSLRDTKQARVILVKALADKHEVVRAWALGALIRMGDKKRVAEAIELLMKTGNLWARMPLAAALADARDPRAKPAFIKALADEKRLVMERVLAARGLAMLGDDRGLPYMLKMICSRDVEEAQVALMELERVGRKRDLELLHRVIEEDPGKRLWAVATAIAIMKRTENALSTPKTPSTQEAIAK